MRLPQSLQARDQQTPSGKSQNVNILGSVNHTVFLATPHYVLRAHEPSQAMCKWMSTVMFQQDY